MALPASWWPTVGVRLTRVGPDAEAGHVVPAEVLHRTDVLVSLGLNDDWRFEDYFRRLSGARVECFPHTVNRSFWRWHALHRLIAFRKVPGTSVERWRDVHRRRVYRSFFAGPDVARDEVMVGYESPPRSQSLRSTLRPHLGADVSVKMGEEGWEYRPIKQLLKASDSAGGLVVEFQDVDLHRDWISGFIECATDYAAVHVHGNNYGGRDLGGDPLVLEATFARRDLLKSHMTGSAASLEFLNCPDLAETSVRFAELDVDPDTHTSSE